MSVKQIGYIAGMLEPATIRAEELLYDNLSTSQNNKPAWFSDPLYSTNTKVARTKNATGVNIVGPGINRIKYQQKVITGGISRVKLSGCKRAIMIIIKLSNPYTIITRDGKNI